MSYYLGIDLGTSYFKTGVFDAQGRLKGLGRCAVKKETGAGDRCELSIAVFWQTLHECVEQALRNASISSKEIKSVSYSSQANSFVLLDKFDKALTPLILWPDKRVKNPVDSLGSFVERANFNEKTGLGIPIGNQSLVSKVAWIQTHQQSVWKRVKSVLSISDYLTYMLTGQKVSDYSTASMTGLLSVSEHKWWNEALDFFSIPQEYLSSPEKTGDFVGKLTQKGAQLLGLSPETKFFLGALDHHVVAIGAGLQYSEAISESTGTVLACVNYQQGYTPRKGVNIAPGLKTDFYFQMAFDENGAVALEWYRENFAQEESISQLLESAEKINIGADNLISKPEVSTYTNLQGFENINHRHTSSHFVRAMLESTSLSLMQLVKVLDKTGTSTAIIPSGGGAQSELWLQIKADMLNKKFILPECSELACQGAAMLGFMGDSSFQKNEDELKQWVHFKKTINPNPAHVREYKKWCEKRIKI